MLYKYSPNPKRIRKKGKNWNALRRGEEEKRRRGEEEKRRRGEEEKKRRREEEEKSYKLIMLICEYWYSFINTVKW